MMITNCDNSSLKSYLEVFHPYCFQFIFVYVSNLKGVHKGHYFLVAEMVNELMNELERQ